jgi:hypothetical protein
MKQNTAASVYNTLEFSSLISLPFPTLVNMNEYGKCAQNSTGKIVENAAKNILSSGWMVVKRVQLCEMYETAFLFSATR